MKKYIRGLYVAVCYAVGLPILFVLSAIVFVPWVIKLMIQDEYRLRDVKELVESYIYGLQCGHKTNMHWIKYGNNPMSIDEMVKDL